ncbi:hypothetical protein I79_007923 [Cricetulus griseus]|uniref:Uncharacterized protein n=1 Tax=Cricetulus griseus TaxID=10029 RepID=G3HBX2_CRIGR|nr:hypothetical protein I79_007923 [Cricetulus griseus]
MSAETVTSGSLDQLEVSEGGHRCSRLKSQVHSPFAQHKLGCPGRFRVQSTVAITDKTSEHSSFPSRSWTPLNV